MCDRLFNDSGVEIELANDNDFLIVKETLTRIGISSKISKKLFQTCHILHKQGRYAIMHFKEMFLMDGKSSTLNETDISRRNKIILLLNEWGLVTILEQERIKNVSDMSNLKVVPFRDKDNWELCPKYNIGRKFIE